MSLNETWLNSSVTDGEINIEGYSLFRLDRDDGYGGVLLYIKDIFFTCSS